MVQPNKKLYFNDHNKIIIINNNYYMYNKHNIVLIPDNIKFII